MHKVLVCLAFLACPAGASASPSIDAAAQCLTDSTNGRDRKALVKWIFAAMSRHPALKDLSAATPQALEESNRHVGQLFTRLIAEDCPKEIRSMVSKNGPNSISKAFEVLGGVAMSEIMTHPDVAAAMGGLEKHSDQARISEVMRPSPDAK